MKCTKCESEWVSKNSVVNKCPFCGAELFEEAAEEDEFKVFDTSAEALIFINKKYGNELLLSSKLSAYIADYAPDLPDSVKRLIKVFYELGASDILRKSINGSEDDKLEAVKKSVSRLTDNFIAPQMAESIVYEFAAALGWSVAKPVRTEKPVEPIKQEQKNQPAKQADTSCYENSEEIKEPVNKHRYISEPRTENTNEGQAPQYSDIDADFEEAKKIFEKAAENGERNYADESHALKIFEMAAEKKNIDAMYYAGVMFLNGMGTDVNEYQAFRYFSWAANLGHTKSQCEVGKLYYLGKGTNQDLKEAERYFRISAPKLSFESMYYCGLFDHNAGRYSSALKEFQRAANEGKIAAAQRMMGIYYENDGVNEVPKNKITAFNYYLEAAQGGDPEGMARLGVCYCKGIGTSVDYSKAIPFLKSAADEGIGLAEYQLGKCYEHGYGVGIDRQKAETYFELAKSHNYHEKKKISHDNHEKNIIKELLNNIPKLLRKK